MKKTTTSNPLKFFNDAKAARNKSFSKSLIKAQDGRIGPMTQQEAAQAAFASSQNNAMTSGEGPRVNSPAPKLGSGSIPAPDYNRYRSRATKSPTRPGMENLTKEQQSEYSGVPVQDLINKVMAPKPPYKKGGTTKATKFAALAPPYNKATAADRIAGAKKNARKKK
jgi:hypothetical protein